ncbi:unnamed protein product [Adineta steineri]|uniref:Uncharacterized protein n=1 Tax=Adineta steineri TaxID=433720 RepID=A0A816BBL1_9BILA|nr:unnamed protein product [Adineta steineri]CAF1606949.1 unnamed protein product [Adineta steineri]
MTNRQYSDWSSAPALTTHGSHSSIERTVWTEDDNDRINQNKTSSTWCYCFKYCIVGSLIARIGLAIILTFWLTSKTAGTETLIVTTSSPSASNSLFASTSISASSNTPLASASISASTNTPSATTLPSSSSLASIYDASNVQLLNNGDFSASSGSTPTNWVKCPDFGQVNSTCNAITSVACYIISTQGGSISQSFSVVSGTNYTVEFDLYHVSTVGNAGGFTLDVAAV